MGSDPDRARTMSEDGSTLRRARSGSDPIRARSAHTGPTPRPPPTPATPGYALLGRRQRERAHVRRLRVERQRDVALHELAQLGADELAAPAGEQAVVV